MNFPMTRDDLDRRAARGPGAGLATSITAELEAAIDDGRLPGGARLPTVRALAGHLGLSPATVAGAYEELGRRGLTRGEPGRGTFIVIPAAMAPPPGVADPTIHRGGAPWRRRLQSQTTARLLAAHPRAVECAAGGPDPELLPLDILRRAWAAALEATTPNDLQYGMPEPLGELTDVLGERLAGDGIEAGARQITVASSALQLVELACRAAVRRGDWGMPLVAVEQPGYATVLDAVDRLGFPMIGLPLDDLGVRPDGLAAAVAAGARLVILTPRSQNPTGGSWTPERRDRLADVLAGSADAVAIEDDHAADVVGVLSVSLITDPRLRSRVVHIRSFSKAIAPDLRVAAAVAAPSLRALMVEEKSYIDGWTSRLAQRALARVLRDPDLTPALDRAIAAYAERRAAALGALRASDLEAAGGCVLPAADGLNLWVRLPPGVDEAGVLERAAAHGFVAGPGEVFHLRPGPAGAVRLTVSGLSPEQAAEAGAALATAAVELAGAAPAACSVVA